MVMSCRRTPARRIDSGSASSRASTSAWNRRRNSGSLVSTSELLAGLGVLDDDQADVGQLALERVDQPDRHHLVAVGEQGQRALPAAAR